MSTQAVTPQISGLPPGAVIKPIQQQAQSPQISGLPAGAIVRPIGATQSYDPAKDPSLTDMMGHWLPAQEDLNPTDAQHPVVASALNRAGQLARGMFSTVAKPPETTAEKASIVLGPVGPIATRLIGGQVAAEKQLAPQVMEQARAAAASHAGQNPIMASIPTLEDARAATTALSMLNPFASGSVANVNKLQDEGKPDQAAGEGITDALALGTGLPGPSKAIAGIARRGITADVAPSLDAAVPQRGITSSSFVPDLKAKAGAVAKVAGQDLIAHVPVVGRVVQRPSFADYATAFKTKADPQLTLFNNTPKLGDSPLFSTAADPLMPASLKPPEPAPAPYRLRGNQIQDATTVTPKPVFKPAGLLGEGTPDVAPAKPQRGITQGKAPYVPGAAMEPAPFLTMHGAESGETAALMQLTHTGGQALRRIATARGLKIPAAADNVSIIQKIHADLSPEEIQSFGDAAKARAQERATSLEGVDPAIVSDNKAIAKQLYAKADEMQAAGESPYKIRAWRTAGESIETRPTSVKDILGNTNALKTIRGVDSRMAQHIQEVTGSGQTSPAGTPSQAAPPRGITQSIEAPKPQLATEVNTEDLLRQSLDVQKARAAAAGAGPSPPGQSPVSTTPPAGGVSTAPQGGHAGGVASSVEELSRPGTNYVVSKSGQLTYHGKSFAPESTPNGSTHVTALPDGTLRVNAGPKLTQAQEVALRKALPKSIPRGITRPVATN